MNNYRHNLKLFKNGGLYEYFMLEYENKPFFLNLSFPAVTRVIRLHFNCNGIAFLLTCCMMLIGARQNVTKCVSPTSNLCSLKKVRTLKEIIPVSNCPQVHLHTQLTANQIWPRVTRNSW